MSVFSNKSFDEITFVDIQNIIKTQEHESQTLEYKKQSYRIDDPQTRNKEIYELLKDVSSFANADGGYIIIGIKQKDNKLGVPEKIVNVENVAEEQDRINKLCLDHIQPRISNLRIIVKEGIDDNENKQVILIGIPPRVSEPHYITFNDLNQVWIRYNSTKRTMSPTEIQKAILETNDLSRPKKETFSKEERRLLMASAEAGGEYYVLSNINQLSGTVVCVRGSGEIYDCNNPKLVAIYYDAFQSLVKRGYIRYEGGELYKLTGTGWKKEKELSSIVFTDFYELVEIADERFDQLQAQCEKKFGRWAIAYQLIPIPAEKSQDELKSILTNDRIIDSNVLREYNGGLEVWLELFRRYLLAKPFGFFYETRPLREDLNGEAFTTPQGVKVFEWTLPIQDMTACIIHSIKVSKAYENIEQIKFYVKYHRLKDRILWNKLRKDIYGPTIEHDPKFNIVCKEEEWHNEINILPNIETQKPSDNLANIVKSLLSPLYKMFKSYEMPDNIYYDTISLMFKRQ